MRLAGADGGYLITPTDACLGFLDPGRLAHLDASSRQVGGDRASKTLALHIAIYGRREGLRQRDVLHHSHAQYALRGADDECFAG
jgi:ribulose-5-phosphate 4-epimerase/fuculose-1-phosphate aldolase